MFAGIFSIYLGWSLYRDRVASKTGGELSLRELKLTLTAAGPGVFLALFGAYLLVSIVNHKVDLSSSNTPATLPKATLGAAGPSSHLLPVAFPAVSSASTPQPRMQAGAILAPPCLVRQRARVLFEGASAPSPTEVEESLEIAAKAVATAATQATDEAQRAKMRRAVALLQDLRSGVVKSPEQR